RPILAAARDSTNSPRRGGSGCVRTRRCSSDTHRPCCRSSRFAAARAERTRDARMTHRYRRIFDLGLGGGQRARAEMDLEIEAHLAMRTADLVGAGWPPDAARAEALRRFGDFDQARRTLHAGAQQRERAMRHRDWWGTLRTDLRLAARHARRSPGYTTLVVAMFAIGVGATTGMFTLVDAVALRPLPFPSPDQLIRIDGRDSLRHAAGVVSSADWLDWKKASALQVSAIYSFSARETLVTDDSAFRVTAERVSSDFFSVLRPRFLVGRGFADADIANASPDLPRRRCRARRAGVSGVYRCVVRGADHRADRSGSRQRQLAVDRQASTECDRLARRAADRGDDARHSRH